MSHTRHRAAGNRSPVASRPRPSQPVSGAEGHAPSSLSPATWFFLLYSPVWVGAVAAVLFSGAFARWHDREYLLFGFAVAAPIWLWPVLRSRRSPTLASASVGRQGAKLALFVTVLSFLQNYFGTPFFTRCFGLEYRFPARIALNGYPVFLSLLTVAYFATYFAVMSAGLRLVERLTRRTLAGAPRLRRLCRLGVTLILAYCMAFVETLTMATDLLAGYFTYASKDRMLLVGSLCYGTLLFCSQLAYLRIEEEPGGPRSFRQVTWDALAVSMLVLCLYELFAYLLARWA
ncbi:MAG TPA: hypothetical protein PKI03_03325 [Pseudomonadota bacterium]|nr:hypothetical protein [Pseudomonadota bacterium]